MFHATTILAYKGKNKAVIGGDGQVSFGNTVLKGNAVKIRKIHNGKVLAGFAGSTADAFNLFDMFEKNLEHTKGDLLKAVIEFSKIKRRACESDGRHQKNSWSKWLAFWLGLKRGDRSRA